MMENGILLGDNYILVNKIQSHFGINLRKDGKSFNAPIVLRNVEPKVEKKEEKAEEPDIKEIELEEETDVSEEQTSGD